MDVDAVRSVANELESLKDIRTPAYMLPGMHVLSEKSIDYLVRKLRKAVGDIVET